jgi:hypothetical protein
LWALLSIVAVVVLVIAVAVVSRLNRGDAGVVAYDVPGTWTPARCGVLVGWEKSCPDGPFGVCPIRTMGGAATLDDPMCPDSTRAVAGLPGARTTDIN